MADAQNAERAAKRARSGSGDFGAGPSNASAAAAPAAPAPASSAQLPDLPIDVLTHLAEECWPASVFFDEGDVCRDAAACMLVGSAPFTALGAALYATVSPLAGTTDVDERSKAAEMKALLKEVGLPVTGTKAVLWGSLKEEIEGATPRCAAARGVRARVAALRAERVSQSRARGVFGLTQGEIKRLPAQFEPRASGFHFGLQIDAATFALADVKAAARAREGRAHYGPRQWARLAASLAGHKAGQRADKKRRDARMTALGDEVVRRGKFTRAQYDAHVLHNYGLDPVMQYKYRWGVGGGGIADQGALLSKAADAAELEIFLQVVGAARLQAIGAYYARLPSATALAAWLRRQGSLAAALSHASLPASARARVAAAWEELQQLEAAAAQQQQQQQAAAAAAQQQAAAAEAQQQMAGAAVAE